MILKPVQLGKAELTTEELNADKKECKRFGPCGVGKKALYLNSFFLDRHYYVPVSSVSRVYKRVAMSKGGFSGKGLFASIPYLVVVYDNGREKQCNFKYEEQVDQMMDCISQCFPSIKLVSSAAEQRLKKRALEQANRKLPEISEEAKDVVRELEQIQRFLEKRPALFAEMSSAAKKKRTYDRTNPSYKWVALTITLVGAVAFAYGIYALFTHQGFAIYFLLFGLAALFLFSGANVLPTRRNNRRAIEERLALTEKSVAAYIKSYPDFPIPAYYAHPITIKRMAAAIREGHATDTVSALEYVKSDLKRLNADVRVDQEEYDEVMAIKPLFLVRDYQ